jgi:hypothetical protein
VEPLFVNSSAVIDAAKMLAPYAGSAAVGGGLAIAGAKTFSNWFFNRHFDEWIVSSTVVSDEDANGYRWLILDNMDKSTKFDDEVRGRDERKAMTRAAKRCNWTAGKRFLIGKQSGPKPEDHEGVGMLHVTRNALSQYWREGTRHRLERKPVDTFTLFFCITGADAAEGAKKKYRVIMMNTHDMRLVLSHPKNKWYFADDTHNIRLETCRIMAQAWMDNGGFETWEECCEIDPVIAGYMTDETNPKKIVKHPIVGWMRAYEPRGLIRA